jgi:hypothetical protein
MASEIGLPFSTAKLARGLEAGIRSWRPAELKPLMTTMCDVTSLAIKSCLEPQGIPASLRATYEEPPEPRTWKYCHVVTVAELPGGSVTIDGTYGQFLPKVLGREGVDMALAQRFRQAGVQCVAFPSETYQEAIRETMTTIFGAEADEAFMERAQNVYGAWWNPANLKPYEPDADTRWITNRILPRMQDVMDMHLLN